MIEIGVPVSDVNTEEVLVVKWHLKDGQQATKDCLLVEVETSKAAIEVLAPEDGIILCAAKENDRHPLSLPIARIFPNEEALIKFQEKEAKKASSPSEDGNVRITEKARKLAEANGISLSSFPANTLIRTAEVEKEIANQAPVNIEDLPNPLAVEPGKERVLLIGGGLGATQVIDIFRKDESKCPVGIIDDSRELWGKEVYGVPIIGGSARLEELFNNQLFDSVVIAISTSVSVRTMFREKLEKLGMPLANAIDSTSKLPRSLTCH